jgi:hypothetical protein
MGRRVCPECGSDAVTNWLATTDFLEDLQSTIECPNGHGEITEEGLLLKLESGQEGATIVSEVGKRGQVICQYGGTYNLVETLLRAILQLENQIGRVDKIVDIEEVSSRQWNRKRAKRRFVKWLKENNNDLPALKDPVLLQLAQRLRSESLESGGTTSDSYSMDDILRWSSRGFLQELKEYELRMEQEPIRFSLEEWPASLKKAFDQARECYRWGLFVATVGMCRVILETVVTLVDAQMRKPSWPRPIDSTFKSIVNSIPPEILSLKAQEHAKSIWDDCNTALHEPGASFDEDDAWQTLHYTAAIASELVKHGAIKDHH